MCSSDLDEAHRLAGAGARFVADFGDVLDALLAHQFADLLVDAVARFLERHLADDDLVLVSFLDDVGSRPQEELLRVFGP